MELGVISDFITCYGRLGQDTVTIINTDKMSTKLIKPMVNLNIITIVSNYRHIFKYIITILLIRLLQLSYYQ